VTGGAGSIGTAICRALAETGMRVTVADLERERAEAVAKEIGGLSVRLDVTDAASVEQAFERCEGELGAVDVLVNCAGWDEFRPFVETDEAFTAKVLDINLVGPIRITRRALPAMIRSEWGRIISVASDAGRVGSSLESIYSGAKGGLIAFTKTIARESARYGVTANSICPGPTDTPLLYGAAATSASPDKMVAALSRAVPMRRIGTPEDIAPAVAFLASEGAGFVTGQTLSVSGGLTMC
jgi:2-hydroxycyclohexanecarboxyl-CoA dehydrogenase